MQSYQYHYFSQKSRYTAHRSLIAYVTFFIGITLLLISTQPVAAEENHNAVANAAIKKFKFWLQDQRIGRGAIAVSYNGRLIKSSGVRRRANNPAPVASLSKAITAVCVAKALRQARKSPKLTLGEAIAEPLSRVRIADARLRNVTIGQLVSHNSGIRSDYLVDTIRNLDSVNQERKQLQLRNIAQDRLTTAPGGGYYYNNANYLLLGLVIEQLTGQRYVNYCRSAVLQPIGVSQATLHRPWRVLSSFGGWEISAIDYAKFFDAYFPQNTVMGRNPFRTGMRANINTNLYYNVGMLMRKTPIGFNFWHVGSWRWRGNSRDAQFGAYAAAFDNGYTVSTNFDHNRAKKADTGKLDRLIYRATHPN